MANKEYRERLLQKFKNDLETAEYLRQNCGFAVSQETALQYVMHANLDCSIDSIHTELCRSL